MGVSGTGVSGPLGLGHAGMRPKPEPAGSRCVTSADVPGPAAVAGRSLDSGEGLEATAHRGRRTRNAGANRPPVRPMLVARKNADLVVGKPDDVLCRRDGHARTGIGTGAAAI